MAWSGEVVEVQVVVVSSMARAKAETSEMQPTNQRPAKIIILPKRDQICAALLLLFHLHTQSQIPSGHWKEGTVISSRRSVLLCQTRSPTDFKTNARS